jgi:hypothetical protein
MATDITSVNVKRTWVLAAFLAVIGVTLLILPGALKWDQTPQIFGYSMGGALLLAAVVAGVRGLVATFSAKPSLTDVTVTATAVLDDFEWMLIVGALALGVLVGFVLKLLL